MQPDLKISSLVDDRRRLGLVAGWGSFPLEIAQRCRRDGIELHVAGLRGHADPRLIQLADRFKWIGVAKLGGQIRFFRKGGVQQVALAGKLFKDKLLYHGRPLIDLLPDWTMLKAMSPIFFTRSSDGRDDTILGRIVSAYLVQGVQIMTIQEVAPSLLLSEGLHVGRKQPSRSQWADIRFGWHVARQMGGLDIGQSITVKDQLILGVEAIEGTDEMIKRTGSLCPRGGFALVKLAKPNQDMRFDVPAIGPGTVAQMAAAGGTLIVVEAHRTILLERDETLATARRLGVTIVAIRQPETCSLPIAA